MILDGEWHYNDLKRYFSIPTRYHRLYQFYQEQATLYNMVVLINLADNFVGPRRGFIVTKALLTLQTKSTQSKIKVNTIWPRIDAIRIVSIVSRDEDLN